MFERKSPRLIGFDYSQAGMYYVTVCTQGRTHRFGMAVGADPCVCPSHVHHPRTNPQSMRLSPSGEMIKKWWEKIQQKFTFVRIDEFIIMPNHLHGIIRIDELRSNIGRGRGRIKGQTHGSAPTDVSLSKIMQWFKTMTTNEYIRGVRDGRFEPFQKRLWQRNYYDHIVRNDEDLHRIRRYIRDNPKNWDADALNNT